MEIRKLQTATAKFCFVTSIRPPNEMDARFKILGLSASEVSIHHQTNNGGKEQGEGEDKG